MFENARSRAPEEQLLDRATTMGTDKHQVDLWIVCHRYNLFKGMPNPKTGLSFNTPAQHFFFDRDQIRLCFLLRRTAVLRSPSELSHSIVRYPKHVEEPNVCIFPYRNVRRELKGPV